MSGSKLKEKYIEQAEKACAKGASVKDLAEHFDVTADTIYRWRKKCSEFKKAIDDGRDKYHITVAEASLLKRLKGYFYNEVYSEPDKKDQKKMVITKVVKRHIPPDTNALKTFLYNRSPERWLKKQQFEHTGKNGSPLLPTLSTEEIEQLRKLKI